MLSEQFLHWRRLLGVADTDSAPDVDDAILHEYMQAQDQKRKMSMKRVRDHLGLPDDGRWL